MVRQVLLSVCLLDGKLSDGVAMHRANLDSFANDHPLGRINPRGVFLGEVRIADSGYLVSGISGIGDSGET